MKHYLALFLAIFLGWCGLAPQKASAAEVYVSVHHGYGHRHHYWVPGHWRYYHHHHRVWVPAHWGWRW